MFMESRDDSSARLFRSLVELLKSCTVHIRDELALAAALMPLRCPDRDEHLARIEQAQRRAEGFLAAAQFILDFSESGPCKRNMPCGDHRPAMTQPDHPDVSVRAGQGPAQPGTE